MNQLAHMAALAHTVRGVTLELESHQGDTLVIAHHRLDAHLTPCQLRSIIVHEQAHGVCRLLRSVVAVRIVVGLEDIGGGLHRRLGDEGEERWFTTTLSHDAVCELFSECPVELPEGAMRVIARPDSDLGVTVVEVAANHPAYEGELDVVATWALAAAMVDELIASAAHDVTGSDVFHDDL